MDHELVSVGDSRQANLSRSVPAAAFFPPHLQEEARNRGAALQLLMVVFKWKKLILFLCLAFGVAAGIAMYMKPPVRTATAKVLLKPDRVTLQISGASSVAGKLPYPPQVMQSEVELMRSREVLLPVARSLLLSTGIAEEDLTVGAADAMMFSLRNNLVAVAFPDSSTIQLTYSAETPEEAVRVLSMILDQYMLQHEVVYTGSTKLLDFYEYERNRVGEQLRVAEEQSKNWQESNNVVSIDEQISLLVTSLGERERALQQAEAELAMNRDNIRDPLIAKLKGDLVAAEVGLQDSLQRYTENDRRVQERRDQVLLLRKELRAAEKNYLTSLTAQRDILRDQVRAASASLAAMRERKVEFDRLSRTVDLAREAYMLYGRRIEEARIASRLDKEQLSNVAVIEEPHALRGTDRNKRLGITLLAALVGFSLGVAIAFGLDFFNNSLRSEDDVEHYLGVPVLAAIPDLKDRGMALES